ncbi:MAG: protein-disulfide reductase DsbD [Thiomargarita sp.]|nr:protein-disulfide reductase DsbD [Thiomargarita sp.]
MNKYLILLFCFFVTYNQVNAQPENSSSELEQILSTNSAFNKNSAFSKFETQNNQVLPPDEAFILSVKAKDAKTLVAHWKIAKGYYLYRNRFIFGLKGEGTLGASFPRGEMVEDVKYGRIEIYEDEIEIEILVLGDKEQDVLDLKVSYQGCAKDRMCYPPIEKTVFVLLPLTQQTPKTQEKPKFLPVEQAFVLSTELAKLKPAIIVKWKIADGYYLYRDKFAFTLEDGTQLKSLQLPPSILKQDPLFGDVQIYQQALLEIELPLPANLQTDNINLKVLYQGCAFSGYCYPPTEKVVKITRNNNLSEQDYLANLLANANIFYTLIVFFGLGLLLSLTPCIFPMIPILSGIIIGQGKSLTTYKAFIMSLIYVLAMAFTYAILGVLTGLLGENLQVAFQNSWVLITFALIFVLLALSMFGFYELQLPSSWQTKLTSFSHRQQGGTLIGVAIMGILSALIVGPCVAAPLVGALMYISQTGDAILGGLALFTMSLGMGVPLIIVGISAGHWLPKAGKWMEAVKAVFGVMLLAIAIWLLARILPGQIIMLLWASLLITAAIYMGALEPVTLGWSKLWKAWGLILLIYGIILIIAASSGQTNPLKPLAFLTVQNSLNQSKTDKSSPFKFIKGVAELEQGLNSAKNKLVMLDFYADWCVSCKEMDYFTFSDSEVQKILANFVLLKTDVTPNDAQDKALYKRFGIFGPPAILFFDKQGQEQKSNRIVGFMSAEQFVLHLTKVIQSSIK